MPSETKSEARPYSASSTASTQRTGSASSGNNANACAGMIKLSSADPSLYGCINTTHPSFLDEYHGSGHSVKRDEWNENFKFAEEDSSVDLNTVYDFASIPDRPTREGTDSSSPVRRKSSRFSMSRNLSSTTLGASTTTLGVRRARSTLLELRYLTPLADDDCHRQGKRFASSVVGFSQGILGSSAFSTCLSFRPSCGSDVLATRNSFVGEDVTNQGGKEVRVQIATGLSSGALGIHSGIVQLPCDDQRSDLHHSAAEATTAAFHDQPPYQMELTYYSTRHTKQATAVSWRPRESNHVGHVAVGLESQRHKNRGEEFCCLVWDVEHQSGGGGGGGGSSVGVGGNAVSGGPDKREPSIKVPSLKFARNVGVASVAWLDDAGSVLGVGTSVRNMHLYDVRLRGTNSPPISVAAHVGEVSGIVPDPFRPKIFATYCNTNTADLSHSSIPSSTHSSSGGGVGSHGRSTIDEHIGINSSVVKLWDLRKMDKPIMHINFAGGTKNRESRAITFTNVSVVEWNTYNPGMLCVGMGDDIYFYDTHFERNGTDMSGGSTRVIGDNDNILPLLSRTICVAPLTSRGTNGTPAERSSGAEESMNDLGNTIQALAFPVVAAPNDDTSFRRRRDFQELYPQRMMVISPNQSGGQVVRGLPTKQISPLQLSPRDGRIVHAVNSEVCMTPTNDGGPTALEHAVVMENEDISATMMRRARCFHAARYSTDPRANQALLKDEEDYPKVRPDATDGIARNVSPSSGSSSYSLRFNRERLRRVWGWIERIENLSEDQASDDFHSDGVLWPARGLADAGVYKLLRLDLSDDKLLPPGKSVSPTPGGGGKGMGNRASRLTKQQRYWSRDTEQRDTALGCKYYDSPLRRVASTACGWTRNFALRGAYEGIGDARDENARQVEDSYEHSERLAALAVFHGELGAAVATLQRSADAIKSQVETLGNSHVERRRNLLEYAEMLHLIAMCIAGYSPPSGSHGDQQESQGSVGGSSVWRTACEGLLSRRQTSPSLLSAGASTSTTRYDMWYIRAACSFLCTVGCSDAAPFDKILKNDKLSLSDRLGFACRFLPRPTLRIFLLDSIRQCLEGGNIEGLYITGLDKNGLSLLQAYVDRSGDVQTAALISSRVLVPASWEREQMLCREWLDSYRELLNTWQMWKSRAMFDVGRADLLRRLVNKQAAIDAAMFSAQNRATGNSTMRQRKMMGHIGAANTGTSSSGNHRSSAAMQPFIKGGGPVANQGGAGSSDGKINLTIPNLPPQVYARCNFCNTSLPLSKLRRQKGIALSNSWLNREKPVLSCCPSCRKPLPRCAVCLLPMGCLNPYLELKRDRLAATASSSVAMTTGGSKIGGGAMDGTVDRVGMGGSGSSGGGGGTCIGLCRTSSTVESSSVSPINATAGAVMDDALAGLANLPFVEWFTWCMRCKHGGHAHHLVKWFNDHDTCPVSGCDCRCQFDRIKKLKRPALVTDIETDNVFRSISLEEKESENMK